MRYFRRLPPLLRVASILGLLFPLASLALLVPLLVTSLPSFPRTPPDFGRRGISALNLVLLGGACTVAVNTYSTRFRQLDRGPFPLSSWQSQVWAIVVGAVLPLCALALAMVAPSSRSRSPSCSWSSRPSPCSGRSCCSLPRSGYPLVRPHWTDANIPTSSS